MQDRALDCRVNQPVGRDRDVRLLLEPEKDRSSARVGRANIEVSLLMRRFVVLLGRRRLSCFVAGTAMWLVDADVIIVRNSAASTINGVDTQQQR